MLSSGTLIKPEKVILSLKKCKVEDWEILKKTLSVILRNLKNGWTLLDKFVRLFLYFSFAWKTKSFVVPLLIAIKTSFSGDYTWSRSGESLPDLPVTWTLIREIFRKFLRGGYTGGISYNHLTWGGKAFVTGKAPKLWLNKIELHWVLIYLLNKIRRTS